MNLLCLKPMLKKVTKPQYCMARLLWVDLDHVFLLSDMHGKSFMQGQLAAKHCHASSWPKRSLKHQLGRYKVSSKCRASVSTGQSSCCHAFLLACLQDAGFLVTHCSAAAGKLSAAHQDDEGYMRMALHQARKGLGKTHPNPAVGCILLKEGKVCTSRCAVMH